MQRFNAAPFRRFGPWVIGYGIVRSLARNITGKTRRHVPDGRATFVWAALLAGLQAAIALGLSAGWPPQAVLLGGLTIFGALFAVNSSLHSYLIVCPGQLASTFVRSVYRRQMPPLAKSAA